MRRHARPVGSVCRHRQWARSQPVGADQTTQIINKEWLSCDSLHVLRRVGGKKEAILVVERLLTTYAEEEETTRSRDQMYADMDRGRRARPVAWRARAREQTERECERVMESIA